jgi:hypothetical protein
MREYIDAAEANITSPRFGWVDGVSRNKGTTITFGPCSKQGEYHVINYCYHSSAAETAFKKYVAKGWRI